MLVLVDLWDALTCGGVKILRNHSYRSKDTVGGHSRPLLYMADSWGFFCGGRFRFIAPRRIYVVLNGRTSAPCGVVECCQESSRLEASLVIMGHSNALNGSDLYSTIQRSFNVPDCAWKPISMVGAARETTA